jgi:hypothetical protein
MIRRWISDARKEGWQVNPSWTMDQFKCDTTVLSDMQRLRHYIISDIRGDGEYLSAAALAHGVWQLMSVNMAAARLVRNWFLLNERNEATGMRDGMLDRDRWVDL